MYGCACQAFKKIGIFLNDPARRGVRVAEEARLESVLGKELHNLKKSISLQPLYAVQLWQ